MDTSIFGTVKQILKTITMILSWTIFSLLILVIGFLAYYLISTNIYASKGEKFEPKFSLYTIVSPSMEPNIKVYDVILNTRVDDPADIKVGDVITFISTSNISNGMTVTHRVTKVVQGPEGLEFKTKGDNNLSEDTDTAKASNVLGKVAIKIPQLGRLQFFLSSKGGWLIVIVCPALFIIVNDIFKILKLNKTKKSIIEAENENSDDENRKKEADKKRKEELKDKLNKNETTNENNKVEEENALVVVGKSVEKKKKNNNKKENNEENQTLLTATKAELIEPQEKHEIVITDEKHEIVPVEKNRNEVSKKSSKKKKKNNKNKKTSEKDKEYNIFGEKKEEYNIFSDNYRMKNTERINEKKDVLKEKEEEKKNIFELPKLK